MTDRAEQSSVGPPRAWPVAVYTMTFGIFGAFPAERRARGAQAVGASTRRYWVAFGVTLAVHALVSLTVIVVAGMPAYRNHQAAQVAAETQRVESALATNERVATAAGIDQVTCTRTGPDGQGGSAYTCVARDRDGRTRDYDVASGQTDVVSWLEITPRPEQALVQQR